MDFMSTAASLEDEAQNHIDSVLKALEAKPMP